MDATVSEVLSVKERSGVLAMPISLFDRPVMA